MPWWGVVRALPTVTLAARARAPEHQGTALRLASLPGGPRVSSIGLCLMSSLSKGRVCVQSWLNSLLIVLLREET
jgi:hypothetical protein